MTDLLCHAWEAREFAYPHKSGTKVGCAIRTTTGALHLGWNIEGLWMTSIHAEVSAISKLRPGEKIAIVAIVAETSFFTPCGACLDWIQQFADNDCVVVISGTSREARTFTLAELMPHYPRQA